MPSRLMSALILAAFSACTPPSSVTPPAGWVKVANTRFDFFVPGDMARFGIPATNALDGEFDGASMRLNFEYAISHKDDFSLTNAAHYRSHEERIGGKAARIVEFYYALGNPPAYHELIAADFPGVDGERYRLHLIALCRTTNDYDTARTIFRTVRFKQ